MKKFVSILMVIITILTIFTSMASAESDTTSSWDMPSLSEEINESEETDGSEETESEEPEEPTESTESKEKPIVIFSSGYYKSEGNNLLVFNFSKKYKTFADDFTLTISEETGSEENVKTFKKSDVICVIESETLAIYIPFGDTDCSDMRYVSISENAVFDESGKGNEESSDIIYKTIPVNITNKESIRKYMKGDEVTYSLNSDADFYVNDNLVCENAKKYTLKIAEEGDYKVTIKRFGLVIYEESFNTSEKKSEVKSGLRSSIAGSALYSFGCIFLAVLSPVLMVFPPLGAAAAASPFMMAGLMFHYIAEYFRIIF